MPNLIEKCRIESKNVTHCNESDEILIGQWLVGEWTNNCNEDICSSETRDVFCSDINAVCDVNERPISEKKCELPLGIVCGDWEIDVWSEVKDFYRKRNS